MPTEDLLAELVDLRRRVQQLVRPGTVAAVDLARARVRVRYAVSDAAGVPDAAGAVAALTDWRPWLTARAGDARTWWAPSVGEQVLLLAPSGELAAAWVLPAGYTDAAPAPANAAAQHRTIYPDGAVAEYDAGAHRLTVRLPADGALALTGGVAITGDVTVTGNLAASGDVTAGGDVSDGATLSGLRAKYNRHTHTPPLGGMPTPSDRA